MTDDLVRRLRTSKLRVMSDAYYLLHDAADRIEQLEAALETVMRSAGHTEADIRAALEEKKDG